MSTMNLSLPEQMRKWVEEQVKEGAYTDASEYVRELILRDREERDELVRALIEGETSGRSERTVREIAAAAKAKIEHGGL